MIHYQATMLADTLSPFGQRMRSVEAVYPRFIHAEVKTHRKIRIDSSSMDLLEEVGIMDDPNLSRNASSSRAIPTKNLIQMVRTNPVTPLIFGRNQSGMQAAEELTGQALTDAKASWMRAACNAADEAEIMLAAGLHKQHANRVLEPFLPIRVVLSGTDWNNFFSLRRHKDAQPEIRYIADLIWDAMENSAPQHLKVGEWHLPYVREDEILAYGGRTDPSGNLRKISAARCARVSYRTHDGLRTMINDDIALCERLIGGDHAHASPFEHQATPDMFYDGQDWSAPHWGNPELHGNLTGFIQHRKLIACESVPF